MSSDSYQRTSTLQSAFDEESETLEAPTHAAQRRYDRSYTRVERNEEVDLLFERRVVDSFHIPNFRPRDEFLKHGHVQTIWGSQYVQEFLRMILFDIPIFILKFLTFNTTLWAALWPKLRYLSSGRAWARENYVRSYWPTIDYELLVLDILDHENTTLTRPPTPAEIAAVERSSRFEYVTAWKARKTRAQRVPPPETTTDDRDTAPSDTPVVVIVHGLENHSRSPQVLGLARWCFGMGFDVLALNHRGCSAIDLDGLRHLERIFGTGDDTVYDYHGGFIDDLLYVTQIIRLRRPRARIFVAGYSLGGNVVSKFLGLLSGNAHKFNICGGFGLCVPFDEQTSNLDSSSFNRRFYLPGLLATLKFKALLRLLGRVIRRLQRFGKPQVFRLDREPPPQIPRTSSLPKLLEPVVDHFADFISPLTQRIAENAADISQARGILRADKLAGFVESYSSPIWGYADPQTFYDANASWRFFHKVRVPFLVVNSYDDPFFLTDNYPMLRDLEFRGSFGRAILPPVRLAYTEYGGHCGFIRHVYDHIWDSWVYRCAGTYFSYLRDVSMMHDID